ncbi:hypothetical protein BH23BAC1_BH23BAC1_50230 [soil metagenome]
MDLKDNNSDFGKTKYTPMEDKAQILSLYRWHLQKKEEGTKDFTNVIRILKLFPLKSHIHEIQYENKDREFIKLYKEFMSKWEVKEVYFKNFPKAMVFEKTKEVILLLLSIFPNYIKFDLTEDCSVFFQASVNNFNIYLELFFTEDEEDGVEAILNIYQESKCIFAYGGSIEDSFIKISSIVSQDNLVAEPTPTTYELPESTLTATEF